MSKFLQTLALAAVLALAASPARGQEDNTSFSYNFSKAEGPATLSFDGDAHYVLRLTKTGPMGNALQNSAGRVQHAGAIRFWDDEGQADFHTTFKFFIRPNPGDDNPGNGFLFLIEPVGSPFPSAGRIDKSAALAAVEFDPRSRRIGVYVGGSDVPTAAANADDDFFITGEEVTAVLDYNSATKVFRSRAISATKTYEATFVIDFSRFFPQQVQVAIAATSNNQVAIHELSSWDFTSTFVRKAAAAAGDIRQYV